MALIYCAYIDYYDPTTSANGKLRVATGSGFFPAPPDPGYLPRLEHPGQIAFSIRGAEGGRRTSNWGDLIVSDPDGALTADLSNCFFDGRWVWVFTIDPDAGWGSLEYIYKAAVDTVAFDLETIRFRLRDRHIDLDTPFSDVKYLGDNSGGAGIEGSEELKDKRKPRILGRIANLEAVCVNPAKLIYQVNDGAIANLINVFDAGAYLTPQYNATNKQPVNYTGATAADQITAIEATEPSAGRYKCAPRAGLFRLSATPFGAVTACVATSWDPADISAAGLIKAILLEKGYSGFLYDSDFTALDQKNAASLGVVVQDGETTASLLDRICQSVGAWWGFSPLTMFRIARFDGPSPDSVGGYGTDVITNGTFASGLSGWTASNADVWTSQSIGGSLCASCYDLDPATDEPYEFTTSLTQAVTLAAGTTYELNYTVRLGTDGSVRGSIQPKLTGGTTVSGSTRTSSGNFTETFIAASGNNALVFQTGSSGFNGAIDDVVLRPITSSTYALSFTDADILDIERLGDDTRALWSATLECDPNDAPQQKSALAGVVDDARLAWLSKPARNQSYADASLKSVRWSAEDKTIPSLLNGLAPALAEAQRRQALYSVRRDTVTVTLTGAARVATLDLGRPVLITTPRLGYSAGRPFVITGISADFGTDTLELNLWG